MSSIFICAALWVVMAAADPEWLLLLSQDTTVSPGYFDSAFRGSGVNNAEDATANLFSIVGGLPSAQYESYKNDADKYQIRMVYNKGADIGGVSWDYTWTQANWLTASAITESDASFEPWGTPHDCARLHGLALSTDGAAYLDGNGNSGCYWHAAGTIVAYHGGMPLDYVSSSEYYIAQQVDVYVCMGGGCTDSSAITTCSKSTDGTYDCGYVACDPAQCDDGNICNGVEGCVDGICVSPDDFECPGGFVCDATEGCVRDCDLFAIDGYLSQCSAEFGDNEAELAGIQSTLGDLAIQTDSLDIAVGMLENATDANTEAVAVLTEDSTAFDARLVAVEYILDAYRPVEGESASFLNASLWEQNKDMMLAAMMLLNVALLLCLCYMSWPKRSGKHVYAAVDYASDVKA